MTKNCKNLNKTKTKTLEKLQHCLEDQIYNSLRKSYVITNISNNSLFAIPANQEFVYIHRSSGDTADSNRFLLSLMAKEISRPFDQQLASGSSSQTSIFSNNNSTNEDQDATLFRKFVFQHVQTALNDGFNDNIGRTNVNPVFELPTSNSWHKIYDSFFEFFLKEPKSSKIQSYYAQLKSHIDIDVQFSENRCRKVLPTALNAYQENLPGHYTKKQHQQRLDQAVSVYHANARGPMYKHYLEQLKTKCSDIWQNGRQLCESMSLTGHCCINELHRLPSSEFAEELDEDDDNDDDDENEAETGQNSEDEHVSRLRKVGRSESKRRGIIHRESSTCSEVRQPRVKRHNSNIITRAASNCGEFQRERKDPF